MLILLDLTEAFDMFDYDLLTPLCLHGNTRDSLKMAFLISSRLGIEVDARGKVVQ